MLIWDIETDGLLDDLTTIHSLVIGDPEADEIVFSGTDASDEYPDIAEGLAMLQQAEAHGGHNIQQFDMPALRKARGVSLPGTVRDTLTISNLIWTDLKDRDFRHSAKNPDFPKQMIGKHSLEAWGHRLGVMKGEFAKTTDWQQWSKEMQDYCELDVQVNMALWRFIQSKNYAEEAIELEHQFRRIIHQQERHGVYFDYEEAVRLYGELAAKRQELIQDLQQIFPPKIETMKTRAYWKLIHQPTGESIEGKTKKDCQERRKKEKDWRPKDCVFEPGPWATKEHPFEPTSRDQIAERLIEKYGWKPQAYTDTGKPQVDETALAGLDYPEVPKLMDFLLVDKRIGQLAEGKKAWLKLVTEQNRIHGRVKTNGAVTGRCTHSDPNMTQVPSVKVDKDTEEPVLGKDGGWGYEFRSLFQPPPGYKQVGCDASGLELRCLSHYMARWDGGKYVKILLEGDVHTSNQEAAGLYLRDGAKTFIYAYCYGAGDGKLGWIKAQDARDAGVTPPKGGNKQLGKNLRARFKKAIPALGKLTEAVQAKCKKHGHLIGLDGRLLHCRSEHSALNTLLQGAGALVMKKALVILEQRIVDAGLVLYDEFDCPEDYDVAFMLNVHDEFQMAVKPEHAEAVGQMAASAITEAGEYFGFRCPLAGKYKIGDNWAETH